MALPELYLEVGPGNATTTRVSVDDLPPFSFGFQTGGFTPSRWHFVYVGLDVFRDDPANADLDFT